MYLQVWGNIMYDRIYMKQHVDIGNLGWTVDVIIYSLISMWS